LKSSSRRNLRYLIDASQEFVSQLMNVQKSTLKAFKTTGIKFEEIFKKLVDMADPVDDPLSPDLQKVIMLVFRKMVERENKVPPHPLDSRTPRRLQPIGPMMITALLLTASSKLRTSSLI
jgi:hypothetical protein